MRAPRQPPVLTQEGMLIAALQGKAKHQTTKYVTRVTNPENIRYVETHKPGLAASITSHFAGAVI